MKTISGKVFSTKPITLSKSAKFLSNFVSSENGASHAINAYLHRTSASFNELKKLHNGLESSHTDKKQKRHRPEASHVSEAIGETPIRNVEISREQSKNKSRRHQLGIQNTVEDGEKPTRNVVECSQESNDVVKYHAGNEGVSEKQMKKKKKHGVESGEHGDNGVETGERENEGKLATKSKESLARTDQSGQEQGHGGEETMGMEEGKKHKREKKKKEKDCMNNISHKDTVGAEHQKGIEQKLSNGGLVDPQELQSKKKKRNEAGSENKINTEEEKREQRTKRKNEEVEDRSESNKRRKKETRRR